MTAPTEDTKAVKAIVHAVLGPDAESALDTVGLGGPRPAPESSRTFVLTPGDSTREELAEVTVSLRAATWRDMAASRADIVVALHIALLADLCDRVPSAREYAADARSSGRALVLDHAAVRTVDGPAGALPPGAEQVARLLEPLGYRRHAEYPLTRLRMTGYAYAHLDQPEDVPQWFVSELHCDQLPAEVRDVAGAVVGASVDPVGGVTRDRLDQVAARGELPLIDAAGLVDALRHCFDRHHPLPTEGDYDLLLAESAEMAWIATEGTACNHCTDRVESVETVAARERDAGRPIKDAVEVSASGRVRQTAHRAAMVRRAFPTVGGGTVEREVPGSFFEMISRDRRPDGSLDLAFDAANATAIFAMTRSERTEDNSE